RIKYRRAPLCIRSKDSNITYASLILDIDPVRKIILLEEFFSKQGLHVFKPKQTIVVSTRYNGQHVNFECVIQKKMRHHGLQGLVVQWPDKIAYLH
ncbi:MAG TPA: flagellar regulator YcgR PilZN domain-containing protein, partial [Gammaproteobacteria bacterium]|nr:flagellar regulator YcgR PilZN domain-containing protein [Gammaproteobacteria bacterium]